jgi:hypothetical protein
MINGNDIPYGKGFIEVASSVHAHHRGQPIHRQRRNLALHAQTSGNKTTHRYPRLGDVQ